MQDLYLFDQIPQPAALLHEVEVEEDWLAPFKVDGSGKLSLQKPAPAGDLRRAQSTSALPTHILPGSTSWGPLSTAPVPIVRGSYGGSVGEFNHHSMESTQTLLGGSMPERETGYLAGGSLHGPAHQHYQQGFSRLGSVGHMPLHHQQNPVDLMDIQSGMPQCLPNFIPTSEEYTTTPNTVAASAPSTIWVPERTLSPPLTAVQTDELGLPEENFDIDLCLINGPGALDIVSGGPNEFHHHRGGGSGIPYGGSCPLPTLLEDAVSGEDNNTGSEDSGAAYSRGFSMDIESASIPLGGGAGPTFGSWHAGVHGGSHIMSSSMNSGGGGGFRPSHSFGSLASSTHQHQYQQQQQQQRGVVRSAPRSVPSPSSSRSFKSRMTEPLERTVRGGVPTTTSLPGSYTGSDRERPLRNAARRSLAVTAAALRDYDDGSDSDSDDVPAFHEGGSRRGGGGGGSAGSLGNSHGGSGSGFSMNAKKKHNPWSLEETEALVHGVQLAGLGKWAEIKRLPVMTITNVLANRSAVDLKDKWRNLTRVARLPKAQLKARLARSASDVPFEVMLAVKGLMENGAAAGSD